ncbi:hypothetical protein TGPRC2_232030 [Toxoplasma gondii TgCatPRC2]|uniref:Uncharacterized protein n=6 Tax=Toxoplasma gondii TaxID=5811 RepID=B9Q4U5_TOXGV|nr:hypothetical protein TGME49_232030 [Toxoplasma gondii ME49]ALA27413.1 inner membrane complex protein 21 [Toxoplasma gondii]ESS35773.1 hypothetical protein TGVEG_232030 [Toxoplasma gondii VEG]KYF46161.1 hypothetical protein TGARI_232030 [Toxoplasma gondii ARI]KYK63747.1 hypothetical protein TGPRC2_232030 [Toxoplasma gondii TgCatPRC2]EPT28894.1 hypothetical protein TGME49_232030 [Toxoplasma gondii ME49]|eukprot:XP_018636827.1 hypothetical protein TGME49_232030 [Toxoplasma gondii ME49]
MCGIRAPPHFWSPTTTCDVLGVTRLLLVLPLSGFFRWERVQVKMTDETEPQEQMPLPEPPESITQRLCRIQQKVRELEKESMKLHQTSNNTASATEKETLPTHDSDSTFLRMQTDILEEHEQLMREQEAEIRALKEQLSKMKGTLSADQGRSAPAVGDSSYCSQPSLLCRWLACLHGSGNDDTRSELRNSDGVLRTTVLTAEVTPPGV